MTNMLTTFGSADAEGNRQAERVKVTNRGKECPLSEAVLTTWNPSGDCSVGEEGLPSSLVCPTVLTLLL